MAAPTYVSSSNGGASDTLSSSKTVPFPAGTQAGDVIVLFIETSDPVVTAFTWPAGFTEIGVVTVTGATAPQNFAAAWKRSAAGEGSGNYTISWSGNHWNHALAVAIRGARTTGNPFEDVQTAITSGTAEGTVTVTTTDTDLLLFFCIADSSAGSTDFNPPTSPATFTEAQDTDYCELAYLLDSTSGSRAVSGGTKSASRASGQMVLAFVPPSSGPVPPNDGAASGAYAWTGAAVGDAPAVAVHTGAASGVYAWTGAATSSQPATPPNTGAAAGSYTWTGAGTGSRPAVAGHAGAASGGYTWTGDATGHVGHAGASAGTYGWTGTATGHAPTVGVHEGQASGSYSWTGSAVGDAPTVAAHSGAASGTYAWTGTAAGEQPTVGSHRGQATGTYTWAGAGTADQPAVAIHEGAASGTYQWTGHGTAHHPGVAIHEAQASGGYGWTGAATGHEPTVAGHTAQASGTYQWTGTASGHSTHTAHAGGTYAWTGTATANNGSHPDRDITATATLQPLRWQARLLGEDGTMTAQVPIIRGSIVYINAAIAEATNRDLTGDTIELAVHRGDLDDATWLPSVWDTPGNARTADPVDFTDEDYPAATYGVYARLTDTPEVPILYAGSIAFIN